MRITVELTKVNGKLMDGVKSEGKGLMIYTFGTYKLDATNYELYDDGHLCKLDSRTLELLIYLVENRDHVVSREELLTHLWPGQIINEGTLHNCIKTARKAIRDRAGGQPKIRNIYGRGYRFVAETQEQSVIIPMFKASEPHDGHTETSALSSSADAISTSQNVLVGDYEFVSILCGALSHPEALISCFGFESAHHLRQAFFALAKAEAQRYEGTFKLYGSDGFLLFFGLQVAHDDDVKRAVKAGLRIQEGLYQCCDALDPQSPVDAMVQMGLHTGLIELRSKPDHYGFVRLTQSETTRLAIRLHYVAKGGEFLTSRATIPYIKEMVKYVAYDAIPMPRQSQPIGCYRISGFVSGSADP
jgi:DNA-binding winged helix-turn-helix (wHTH) protein/class 3 adenylate cyclase